MLVLLYAILFLQTLALGWMLTALMLRLAGRLGFVDHPGERKIHRSPKPVLGGVAVYAAFLIALAFDVLLIPHLFPPGSSVAKTFPIPLTNVAKLSIRRELWAVLSGSFMMFVLGLIDDRRPLRPSVKLLVQFIATIPLLVAGVRIQGFLPAPVGGVLTVLWVIFLTNAFNFIDNMDGLCGGVAAICLGVYAALAYSGGEWFMAAIYIALAGAIVGFLRYNWFPSKIFLGDAGSLTIGYLIASLAVLSTYLTPSAPTSLAIFTPLVVLGVPIFDSLSVYYIRLREGRPLWKGDTSHFSHRLVALGLTQKQAVMFIYLVTLTMGLAAWPLRNLPWRDAVFHVAHIGLVFVIIAFLEAVGSSDPNRNRPDGR